MLELLPIKKKNFYNNNELFIIDHSPILFENEKIEGFSINSKIETLKRNETVIKYSFVKSKIYNEEFLKDVNYKGSLHLK